MNLIPADIKNLKKVTVKINCTNGSEGSGTIVCVNDTLYVLTAAHVIENKEKKGHLEKDDIFISITRNSQLYSFGIEDFEHFERNEKIDAAVLRVGNSGNMPIEGLDKVRILTSSVNGAGVLCGYHNGAKTPKHYKFEHRGGNDWAICDIELKLQGEEPVKNFEGTSGGGIFYQDTLKNLYLVAYMSGLGRLDGNNNEFKCPPSSNFCQKHIFDKIIDSRDFDYIEDSGVAVGIELSQILKPLDRSGYELNQTEPLIKSKRTTEIIEQLRDDDVSTILITGLSGMGKTKLIYEAFRGTELEPNRYYAKYGGNREGLIGEITIILRQNSDSDGIIIIDDCPMEMVSEIVSIRNQYNAQFRLIMANHDYFNEENDRIKTFPVLKLNPDHMRENVERYISETIGENEYNKNDVAEIKRLAEGYPQMAIELVKTYLKDATAGPEAVSHLMPKLLSLTPGREREEKRIWQTLSLCMPFPYFEAAHEGFRYMLSQDLFTPLDGVKYESRRSIAVSLVRKYSPTIIDVIGDWLHVRPFPLAVWLTATWFNDVCNSAVHFQNLIDDIKTQPKNVQNAISEGFCLHIQQMSGNKEAFKMVEKLVTADNNDPFFNEETLCSGLGSKLFLAMSTVNPAAIASCLKKVIGNKDTIWLKEVFVGEGRRNVVWALERLCFAKESYKNGVAMMAKLAAAENEDIGNNATSQLVQLFHIALAGTEVDLEERLDTLKQLVKNSEISDKILVRCFDAAFRNGGFSKMGGAEKFGFENRKDYAPKTWEEIFHYWHGCLGLLLAMMEDKPEMVDLIAKMVEGNVYHWARGGQKSILIPLLEKIAKLKDYRWDGGYEALAKTVYTFGLDDSALGVKELMEKLRGSSFMTKLKDARFKLHGRFQMEESAQTKLLAELFGPLADGFLHEEIFLNEDEVKSLLEDDEYMPIEFTKSVVAKANDTQLTGFFNTAEKVLSDKPEEYYSPFLGMFSYESRERKPLTVFLDKLRDSGRELLYIALMAGTEDAVLSHFHHLFDEQNNNTIKQDFLPIYLRYFRSYGTERYLLMLRALKNCYPDRPNDLVDYVESERFVMRKDERQEAVEIVKDALLSFVINGDNGRQLTEYSRILIEALQLWHDEEFARKVNKKMIAVYNTQMVHLSTEGVFTELLKEYLDVVWSDFIKAFLGEDSFLFYYQVKDELGSGFGFGKGPLFDLDENLIKQLCLDNPETAPVRIATMVPCFDAGESEDKPCQFSKWIIWLLDNFGEQKDVRDGISANLGSFTWSGNVSPYYTRNIQCYEKLLSHPKQEVRDWAHKCIDQETKLQKMEKSNEDFMRIRYGMN